MEVKMHAYDGTTVKEFEGDVEESESALWEWVAARMSTLPFPTTVSILAPAGSAQFEMKERGSWFDEAGKEHPSMFVVSVFNAIDLPAGAYGARYLTCIHENARGGRGNYKFYWMEQLVDGRITARYGRIGQGRGFGAMREIREPMDSWLFWLRYYEKLSKGYQDAMDIYLAKGPEEAEEDGGDACSAGMEPDANAELFELLLS